MISYAEAATYLMRNLRTISQQAGEGHWRAIVLVNAYRQYASERGKADKDRVIQAVNNYRKTEASK